MLSKSHHDKINLNTITIPYPTHVGAPKIESQNLTSFKNIGITKINKIIKRKFEEIVEDTKSLQDLIILQEEVYGSKYNFEPIVGEIYHLYENLDGSKSLSLISPNEWSKKYLYSVILNSDMSWKKIE